MDEVSTKSQHWYYYGIIILIILFSNTEEHALQSYYQWHVIVPTALFVTIIFGIFLWLKDTDDEGVSKMFSGKFGVFLKVGLVVLSWYGYSQFLAYINLEDHFEAAYIASCTRAYDEVDDVERCMYARGVRNFSVYENPEEWRELYESSRAMESYYNAGY